MCPISRNLGAVQWHICGSLRCIGIRGDAWLVLLSPCNTSAVLFYKTLNADYDDCADIDNTCLILTIEYVV